MRVVLSCVAIALTLAGTGAPAYGQTRVLMVDFDDVGFDLLRETETPTLDWLKQHGRFYTQFTAAPLCSPTRAMIQTGAYPSHPSLLLGQVVLHEKKWAMPTEPLIPIAQLVADAGYSTAKVGKWHLGGAKLVKHPIECGWQSYRGCIANLQQDPKGYFAFPKATDGGTSVATDAYITTDETSDALAFVREGVDLVSLSYHAPHRPWHEPPAHLHSVAPIRTDRDRARAALQAADTEFSRLASEALARGYLLIVYSDNGTPASIGGKKGGMSDSAVVVPLWVCGNGVVPGIDTSPIGAVDLYATIAGAFGVPSGSDTRGPSSRSMVMSMLGLRGPREITYSERFRGLGQDPRKERIGKQPDWIQMARGRRYKLHRLVVTGDERLVDVIMDPDETVDLLQSELTESASKALTRLRAELDVHLPGEVSGSR